MCHVVQEWCAAALERLEIDRFIVWRARLPTPIEDAEPSAGQGAHGCLVRLALVALLLGVTLSPEGMPCGVSSPLHNRWHKFRALPCRLSIGSDTRQGRHSDSTTLQLHMPTRLMTVWAVPLRDLRCLAGVLTA